MSIRKSILTAALLFFCISALQAEDAESTRGSEYVLTEFPLAVLPQDTSIWIKWGGAARPTSTDTLDDGTPYPDSGFIYLSRDPGGRDLANYEIKLDPSEFVTDTNAGGLQNNITFDDGEIPERGCEFIPSEQSGIDAGIYYLVVGFETTIEGPLGQEIDTTFVSNEIKFIVRHKFPPTAVSPVGDTLENVTPLFEWNSKNDVPYYHIIALEGELDLGDSINFDSLNLDDLNVIWQAVTPETEITYGAPDPSGIITASPKPLSAGETYTWLVLNNYGNNPVMTAAGVVLPSDFHIAGEKLTEPINVSPVADAAGEPDTLTGGDDGTISFRWTGLDPLANTYQLYIYKTLESGDITAKTPVWDQEYSAAQFSGDTAEVSVSAQSNLVNKLYSWNVIAKDAQGKGTSGGYSEFYYEVPAGSLIVKTREIIRTDDGNRDTAKVALAEINVEVLEGPMESLVFYTDNNGYLGRDRTAGRLRLTAVKEGFKTSDPKTVDIFDDSTTSVTFFLERPASTIYGKVTDSKGKSLGEVNLTAVSDKGDTARAQSDPQGNFILSCYKEQWNISAKKTGYTFSSDRRVSLDAGENLKLTDPVVLTKKQYLIRGTVTNGDGNPLVGAAVDLLSTEGELLDREHSTSSDGSYSFDVNSGTYILKAYKSGFVSQRDTLKDVTALASADFSLQSGAVLITGGIQGRTYNSLGTPVVAPVTEMDITLLQGDDTIETTVSGDVYGTFSLSVPRLLTGETYDISYNKSGYQSGSGIISPGEYTYSDTVNAFAALSGMVYTETGSPAENVTVTLAGTERTIAQTETDYSGTFEFTGLPDMTDLDLTAAARGSFLDSSAYHSFSDTLLTGPDLQVSGGRVLLESTPVSDVKLFMKEGTVNISFTAQKYSADGAGTITATPLGTEAGITVKRPLSLSMANGDTLFGAGAGTYTYSTTAQPDSLIDCAEKKVSISPEEALLDDTTLADTVMLPFVHESQDTLTAEGGITQISVGNYGFETNTVDSIRLFYRDQSHQSYDHTPMSSEEDGKSYSADITPPRSGSKMVYYFRIYTADGSIYGTEKERYTAFIKPDPTIITKVDIQPSLAGAVIPEKGRATFSVTGYYSDNLTTLSQRDFNSDNFTFTSTQGMVKISTNRSGTTPVVVLEPKDTGKDTITVSFVTGTDYSLSTDLVDTMRIPIEVVDQNVDSIALTTARKLSGNTILNNESLQFLFTAFSEEGEKLSPSPTWQIIPDSAGTIGVEGIFQPRSTFSGPVRIIASYGKRLSTEYTKGGSPLNVRHSVSEFGGRITDFTGISLDIPHSSSTPGSNIELGILHSQTENEIKNNIAERGISRIGRVYTISKFRGTFRTDTIASRAEGDAFVPADSVLLRAQLPREYHSLAAENGSNVSLAVWDEDSLGWDHPWRDSGTTDSTWSSYYIDSLLTYSDESHTLTVPAGEVLNMNDSLRFAMIYRETDSLSASVSVSPNPFSPFVPNGELEGPNRDIPGTVIEILPLNSTTKANIAVTIEIVSVSGEKVWQGKYNTVSPGSPLQIIWDGRTRINKNAALDESNDKHTLHLRGDKMCRNGRYFMVATVDDGSNRKRYTKEIILFK
ncbi:MAG: carboxypeptidase regulatory-like domain-containing protein [Fibrobacterota bacterium]